eukprot:PITA_02416
MANVLALTLAFIVIVAGGSVGRVAAQSSSSCSAALVSLAPCLAFLQGGANNSSPTQGCCTGLASVVSTSAACLCQMVTTTNNPLGIPINQTQALALPGACKITTPPVSQCKSTSASNPPAAAAPSSPTPVVSNPTPTAKSPATSATLPPTTTPTTGGALSPFAKEGPTASANSGSMMGVDMLIHVVAIMASLTFIISASSI